MKKALLTLGLCGSFACAQAGPAAYVFVPAVEYGEMEVDFKFGTGRDGAIREHAASLGFGWGATPWWFTEVYAKWEKAPGAGTKLEAWEWENKFQLTETGRYAVDLGLITEIEIPRDSANPKEFKFGPLLQTESGKLQYNLNLWFERKFGGNPVPGEVRVTEIGYQWQVKYRQQPAFEFGLQGFGEMGEWNKWVPQAQQLHNVGPAVFGRINAGGGQKIRYNAAWLFGLSDAAPAHTLRMQMEYEF